MKIKEKIRQRASVIFDMLIPEKQWERYFELLDHDGHPNRKEMLSLFIALCSQVEKLETLVEDLYFQIEILEGTREKGSIKTQEEEFKLRSAHDVALEMDKEFHPNTQAFYVSPADFAVLEKTMDAALSKTDPNHGYSKEIDPKDGMEKVCLLYRNLPVFKTT